MCLEATWREGDSIVAAAAAVFSAPDKEGSVPGLRDDESVDPG